MFNTKEKKERSLGTKLFLKPHRCNSPKCVTVRRPNRPGLHGAKRRRAPSEYGTQLQEKQKIRFMYGIREKYLVSLFKEAAKKQGLTGETMISFLERRLDNVVFRLGIAESRSIARQFVSHGHILVNGKKIRSSSHRVKVGDVITVRPQSMDHTLIKEAEPRLKNFDPPVWLDLDKKKLEGKVIENPKDMEIPLDLGLVVDFYSK